MRIYIIFGCLLALLYSVTSIGLTQATPEMYTLATGAGPITVSVSLSSAEVYPRNTGGTSIVTVTVTAESGQTPLKNRTVSLNASATGGGHNHTANRPVGSFASKTGKTNNNGVFSSTYNASEFGGTDTITATCGGSKGSNSLTVRVPNLVTLGAGTGYSLVGSTTTHPDNHYVTASTRTHLQNIALDWHNAQGPTLRYNDCSLIQGGRFDISANWSGSHAEHRVGTNCDLSNSDDLTQAQQNDIATIIGNRGGDPPYDEGNHWHLRF